MATTTATITLSSSDLTNDTLALTQTTNLNKANTVTGLDQTTGVGRITRGSTADYTLFDSANYSDAKAHKVYLKNTSSTATEYMTLKVNTQEIGRLYAGDWAFMPWNGGPTANVIVNNSVATNMTLEYALIYEA
jgi:hypothetical protein